MIIPILPPIMPPRKIIIALSAASRNTVLSWLVISASFSFLKLIPVSYIKSLAQFPADKPEKFLNLIDILLESSQDTRKKFSQPLRAQTRKNQVWHLRENASWPNKSGG
ncbi:MAG: hypothetical protein HDQ91_00855 [Desulfovibrio sp.]|nr:hypothetical protein [Desulfovibrio sp.]